MYGIKVRTENQMNRVKRSAEKAAAGNIFSAAGLVRKSAIDSIQRSTESSDPGQPPHTRRRQLPRAIVFHADKATPSAIVGPRKSFVGESGVAHEFGGQYRGQTFPQRPFMYPALERTAPAFAGTFRGSIGK